MGKKVLAVVEDLFFSSKITAVASQLGSEVRCARSGTQALEIARREQPALIILDLNAAGCSPLQTLSQLKASSELKEIPVLGFVSHQQTELIKEALQAGCDRVLARSALARELPQLLS
jgi:CheY-like chemotaxis protein